MHQSVLWIQTQGNLPHGWIMNLNTYQIQMLSDQTTGTTKKMVSGKLLRFPTLNVKMETVANGKPPTSITQTTKGSGPLPSSLTQHIRESGNQRKSITQTSLRIPIHLEI